MEYEVVEERFIMPEDEKSKIFYSHGKHKEEVRAKLKELNKIYQKNGNEIDLYYLPVFYLFYGTEDLKRKCIRYVKSDSIDFQKMYEEVDFSSGEKILVNLAHNLFNNGVSVALLDIIATLDDENFKMALQAIILRRHSLHEYEL